MGERHNKVRREAIKQLVQRYAIEDQDALVSLLKADYAIETNQSIVSRDLRQLSIGKQVVGDKSIYQLPTEDPTREILRLAVLGIENNEALIVVHTLGGLATFVGDYLDQHKEQGILATLAGENVVFVVPKSMRTVDALLTKIRALLYHHETVRKK